MKARRHLQGHRQCIPSLPPSLRWSWGSWAWRWWEGWMLLLLCDWKDPRQDHTGRTHMCQGKGRVVTITLAAPWSPLVTMTSGFARPKSWPAYCHCHCHCYLHRHLHRRFVCSLLLSFLGEISYPRTFSAPPIWDKQPYHMRRAGHKVAETFCKMTPRWPGPSHPSL